MARYPRPGADEHPPYFSTYVDEAPDEDVLALLDAQIDAVRAVFGGLDAERALHRYAPGKWSLKEVLGHLADTERVFGYRGLAFARGETAPQPGMDENAWVDGAGFDAVPLGDLVEGFVLARTSVTTLLRSLSDAAVARSGTADGKRFTVRCVPWILAGHVIHHLGVVRERYGV